MIGLVDCNNFYASCERLFRPDLEHRPIAILSNNDGCVIARSNELKRLGVPMGAPYFQIKELCAQQKVAVFSSNYTLYGDLSQRVMSTIIEYWPDVEIYSIDEAFIDISTMPKAKQFAFCSDLQARILQHTGIPTSIGMGRTKTLAKLANHIAKKYSNCPVVSAEDKKELIGQLPIDEVWGIGKRWASKLKGMQVHTVADLHILNPSIIKSRFNVVMQRTVYELQGISCLALEDIAPKKSITASRSFGTMQTSLISLEEALSNHVMRAWQKLRQQQLTCAYICVFIQSNRHRKDLRQYRNSKEATLINSSDDARVLIKTAKKLLKDIYKPGIQYKKIGVLLDDLRDKEMIQQDLLMPLDEAEIKSTEKVMQTINKIQQRFGNKSLYIAATKITKQPSWHMKKQRKSPHYTTNWNELATVRI